MLEYEGTAEKKERSNRSSKISRPEYDIDLDA